MPEANEQLHPVGIVFNHFNGPRFFSLLLDNSLLLFSFYPWDLSLIPTDCGSYIHWVSLPKKIAPTWPYIPIISLTSTSRLEYLQSQFEFNVKCVFQYLTLLDQKKQRKRRKRSKLHPSTWYYQYCIITGNTGIQYTISHTASSVYRKYPVPTAASIRGIGIHWF